MAKRASFFDFYHPFLPFLDASKPPDNYYNSSTCLFWVIIGIASRRYREDVTLLTILSELVTRIVWNDISHPPYTVPGIQAIVALSIWPFPTTSTWHDTSTTLSSIAVSAAMQLGLHRPQHAQDFLRESSSGDLRRLAKLSYQIRIENHCQRARAANSDEDLGRCQHGFTIVSVPNGKDTCIEGAESKHSAGLIVGQLPNTPFDWTIDRACEIGNAFTLPEGLRFKLIIHRYCDRITRVMSGNSNHLHSFETRSQQSLSIMAWDTDLTMLEDEIMALEREHSQHLSCEYRSLHIPT